MKIMPVQNNKNREPSFKMNIKADKSVLELLEAAVKLDVQDLDELTIKYYGNDKVDFKKHFKAFQEAFSKYTKDDKATITLKDHPLADEYLMISYKAEDGTVTEISDGNGALAIQPFYFMRKYEFQRARDKEPNEKPFWNATMDVLDAVVNLFFEAPTHDRVKAKQYKESYYRLASKIVPKAAANYTYLNQYTRQVKEGIIDDFLNYGIKKEERKIEG